MQGKKLIYPGNINQNSCHNLQINLMLLFYFYYLEHPVRVVNGDFSWTKDLLTPTLRRYAPELFTTICTFKQRDINRY